jgi:hypothetical protein
LMVGDHLVRVGRLGRMGRFRAAASVRYPRHADVVVRTGRGLEVGQVVAPFERMAPAEGAPGTILRRMNAADRRLAARLSKEREAALGACSAVLSEQGLDAVLIDVEHLFDGRSLYFYYLGDVAPAVAAMTDRLAEAYPAQVNFCKFTEVFEKTCGRGCGTQSGGASCGGCQAECPLSSGCGAKDV